MEEAGAEKAGYALKLLQSEGELTIASTGKDPATGKMVTQEYHVEGPVMIFLTTTAIDLDEELQNRCLTLTVDESAEQTGRIHQVQRERRTLAGLMAREERKALLKTLRNAQRLLQPVEVLNPYAPALTFTTGRTRNRRDHEKYLTLIDAIALLHQHQRKARNPAKRRSHTSKSRSMTLRWQTSLRRKCWAAPWTNCRRRPAACWVASASLSRAGPRATPPLAAASCATPAGGA